MTARTDLPLNRIMVGDARTRLQELPDAAVDTVITSPPYWQQRDYGVRGQLGAEATVGDWVDSIVGVCDQLARVLSPGGSLWLNLGDSFSRRPSDGAARKSLLLAPQQVALRLTQHGWTLRNYVVWHKPNAMPSSVRDRLTTTHEALLFLTRQPHYYFNHVAIREPTAARTRPLRRRPPSYPPRGAVPTMGRGSTTRVNLNHGLAAMKAAGRNSHPDGKNLGDVWTIPTGSYRGAHFATFPLELVIRPLLATCPERVCTGCGRPWRRRALSGAALGKDRPLQADCRCRAPTRAGIVLDPFAGSGTVALAAEQYNRDWLGIELNPTYVQLADQRLADWRTAHQRT